ncbi:hypothetical protein AeMF1_017379, partial [Aphanomyces euteiches]
AKRAQSILPDDVVLKIALAIPEAEDVFAFLEALRPYINLGPLEHLYKLGLTHNRSELWPTLRIRQSDLDSPDRSLYEAIAEYYTNVRACCLWDEIKWLETNLNRNVSIEWFMDDMPYKDYIDDAFYLLPITRLDVNIEAYEPLEWSEILLPRLKHLTSVKVETDYPDLSDLLSLVATSGQITELNLCCCYGNPISDDSVDYLTKWLRHQPVRKFVCRADDWEPANMGAKRKIFQAVFNCATLEVLELWSFHVDMKMDVTGVTLAMKSLTLNYCIKKCNNIKALAARLQGSNVTRLALNESIKDVLGIQYLFQVLPQTSIKSLALICELVSPAKWLDVAPLIAACPLEKLTLGIKSFDSTIAQSLAAAIQRNRTIFELHFCHSSITTSDLELLIRSVMHPNRQIKSKKITLFANAMDSSAIKSLEELVTRFGGRFRNTSFKFDT